MQIKWDSPESKNSHENKPIQKHISEVKSNLDDFLKFYDFDKKYFEIGEFLSEFHDAGKTHPDWHLGSKEGHAQHSLEYIIEKEKKFPDNRIDPLLKFLILKHHSTLTKSIKDRYVELKGKRWSIREVFNVLVRKELESSIGTMTFKEKVNLVDTFGLFKLADVCSAGGRSVRFEKPDNSQTVVRKIISKAVDDRWNEQMKLTSLPDMSMLRAYTGWGKTDAGLLFFANKNALKIFYLFPTTSAINKFYTKINSAVQGKASKYFFFSETEIKEDEEKLSNMFFIKNFVSPYNLTTVDQLLLSFLQVGKYYTKRVMFKQAGIIVDEVHLLNPLMLGMLTYFINQYRQLYSLKVLFMSATLSNALSKYLQDNFNITTFLDCRDGYETKRRIMWEFIEEDIENSLEKIIAEKMNGNKVLVIVNTVDKAISIGKKLETQFKLAYEQDFIVFHARFMYKHRREKEDWLEKTKEKPHILVSTQVCEVSLDLSYNILFTETASMPSIIQRFGRVNRYGNKTNLVNVYVFNPSLRVTRNYPYTINELNIAHEILVKFEKEKLLHERQLIDELDILLTYEDLIREIELAKKEVGMPYWEELLQFFYSFEMTDEKLAKLLNYREGFTTLVIPHPNCIRGRSEQEEVVKVISKPFSNLSWEAREKTIAEIKELSVPVPIWWLKEAKQEEGLFPVVEFNNRIYDYKYGFYKAESK